MKREELKQEWSGMSEEILEGVAQWREGHPRATMREIEDEIDKRLSALRAQMCLKVKPPWAMPEEAGRIGKMLLKENDPYRLIGDQLFEKWEEEEFADLYSHEGKPRYSPVMLAFVSVFQFMERLADRQAAQALRMRLDWKYTLHLTLEDEGFDFSVLSEFRDRLIEGKAEKRVFEKLVRDGIDQGTRETKERQHCDAGEGTALEPD